MKEVIILILITGFVFVLFVSALIMAIVRKNSSLKIVAAVLLLCFLVLGGWTAYTIISKSYEKVSDTFRARTGDEIYAALFGAPSSNCVKILDKQDQVIPKIDYAIWLHFKSCPEEMKRILAQENYSSEKIAASRLTADGPASNDQWFNPSRLGDSAWMFVHRRDEYGNGQTIYMSLDSTEAYCKDVHD